MQVIGIENIIRLAADEIELSVPPDNSKDLTAGTQPSSEFQPNSVPFQMIDFWVPLIGSLFAIILGCVNLYRSIQTDKRIKSSRRESDFNNSVGAHRTELLDFLARFKLAIETVRSAPEHHRFAAQENLHEILSESFAGYERAFFAMRIGHYDWAKEGEDQDIPADLQRVLIDKVFCFMDALAPNLTPTLDETRRFHGQANEFDEAVDEATRRLKLYRDSCCPRRQSRG